MFEGLNHSKLNEISNIEDTGSSGFVTWKRDTANTPKSVV